VDKLPTRRESPRRWWSQLCCHPTSSCWLSGLFRTFVMLLTYWCHWQRVHYGC